MKTAIISHKAFINDKYRHTADNIYIVIESVASIKNTLTVLRNNVWFEIGVDVIYYVI